MNEQQLDQKYYTAVLPGSAGERLAVIARDQIYKDFIQHIQPTAQMSLLDVGVSDVAHRAANVIERKYPYPGKMTASGLGVGADFKSAFPEMRYVQLTAGAALPFRDKEFDVATSNAVLEHVSSREQQVEFIRELRRVSRRVFISVPNRFFPVEHHTAIPLLHWHDTSFRWACRQFGKNDWAEEENLILMSRSYAIELANPFGQLECGYTGIKLGPFSSNLYIYITD